MIVILSVISYANEYLKVYNFNFDDYKYGIEFYEIEKEQFSSVADAVSSETLGPIDSARVARRKAVSIFKKAYDKEMLAQINPCKVYFDENNDIWLVKGTLPKNTLGSVPIIMFEKQTGKIIALWFG